jgi:hypothetical protein
MNEFYKVTSVERQEIKVKYIFKTNKIFFFFVVSLTNRKNFFIPSTKNSENWIDFHKIMLINKLKYFKTYTKTIKSITDFSIFNSIDTFLTNSVTVLINFEINVIEKFDFKMLTPAKFFKQLPARIKVLVICINKKLYVFEQIQKIKNLTYIINFFIFFKLLQYIKYFLMLSCFNYVFKTNSKFFV